MIQPSELLQHLGMTRVVGDYTLVGVLRTDVVFLLFVNVADLKPYVGVCKWGRRVAENAVEAGERLVILALLLVDYA